MNFTSSLPLDMLQRRRLLGMGALSALSLAVPGVWAQAVPGSLNNGRLIVVFLRGAYDGLSAFVPYADKDYYALRPKIAIAAPDGYKTDANTWLAPEALTRRADYAMGLGQRTAEPAYLSAFFSVATRERIAQEPAQMRTGLMLASPDFMRK